MKNKIQKVGQEEKAQLIFLKRTKEGKYTKIKQDISTFEKSEILREESLYEEDDKYYYSLA